MKQNDFYEVDGCTEFNPDGTFELLLECHAILSRQILEVE